MKACIVRVLTVALLACGWLILAPTSEAAKPGKKRDPMVLFKKMDTNNDGKVSKAEWEKFWQDRQAARAAKGKGKGKGKGRDGLFAKLDTNNYGYLSPEEFGKIAELKGK